MMGPSVGPVARMPMGSNRVVGDSDGADESLCVCGIFYTLLGPSASGNSERPASLALSRVTSSTNPRVAAVILGQWVS